MESQRIIDISPMISEKTAVFPGDTPFSRNEVLSFEKGHNLVLSSVTSTVHIGAHTDAPNHYHPDGRTIDQQPLDTYVGQAQVIETNAGRGERITPSHLETQDIQASRVLLKTSSFPNPDKWNGDFNSCSPELIDFFASKNVILVGIDTPSVDPADDKELLSHNTIYKNDMAILEGIVLDNVEAGLYQLVALPLPLAGCDASPVRAILMRGNL